MIFNKIRALVVDDHEVVLKGIISMMLGTRISVDIAATGKQAFRKYTASRHDVILSDINLAGYDGFALLESIREWERSNTYKPAGFVFFSSHTNPTYVARAIALGASGYVLKGATFEELFRSIESAAESWPSVIANDKSSYSIGDAGLTEGELFTLKLLANGHSNRDIAGRAATTLSDVVATVASICSKLGVADRVQAALWAVRKGIA